MRQIRARTRACGAGARRSISFPASAAPVRMLGLRGPQPLIDRSAAAATLGRRRAVMESPALGAAQ